MARLEDSYSWSQWAREAASHSAIALPSRGSHERLLRLTYNDTVVSTSTAFRVIPELNSLSDSGTPRTHRCAVAHQRPVALSTCINYVAQ